MEVNYHFLIKVLLLPTTGGSSAEALRGKIATAGPSAFSFGAVCASLQCEGRESNPRTPTRADLESAAVGRLATLARSRGYATVTVKSSDFSPADRRRLRDGRLTVGAASGCPLGFVTGCRRSTSSGASSRSSGSCILPTVAGRAVHHIPRIGRTDDASRGSERWLRITHFVHPDSSRKPTALAVGGMRHWGRFRNVFADCHRTTGWSTTRPSAGKLARQRHSSWTAQNRRENRFVGRVSVLSGGGREVQCGPTVPDGQRALSGSSTSARKCETRRPSGLGTGQRAPEKSEQAIGTWMANVAPHSYRRASARRSEPESTTNQSGVRWSRAVPDHYTTRLRRSLKRGPKPHPAARCRCGAGGSPRLQSWAADDVHALFPSGGR